MSLSSWRAAAALLSPLHGSEQLPASGGPAVVSSFPQNHAGSVPGDVQPLQRAHSPPLTSLVRKTEGQANLELPSAAGATWFTSHSLTLRECSAQQSTSTSRVDRWPRGESLVSPLGFLPAPVAMSSREGGLRVDPPAAPGGGRPPVPVPTANTWGQSRGSQRGRCPSRDDVNTGSSTSEALPEPFANRINSHLCLRHFNWGVVPAAI